jgi:hypothetical protein
MRLCMIDALVDGHVDDIRRQVSATRAGTSRGSRPASGTAGSGWLRSRLGFALVEAGLHLLAARRGAESS